MLPSIIISVNAHTQYLHLALIGRVEVRVAARELLVKLLQKVVREGRVGRARAVSVGAWASGGAKMRERKRQTNIEILW